MRFWAGKVGNRRELFRAGLRYTLLAVLAAAASLSARTRRPAGQNCVNRGICGSCAAFIDCGLPQALSAKQAKGAKP
jgi:hypothetical protein